MERLTKYGKTSHENGVCCTHFNGNECTERMGNCTDNCPWEEAVWSRLAAYEDTGLAPEDCAAYKKFEDNLCASGVPFSRIIELVNAEKAKIAALRPITREQVEKVWRGCPECKPSCGLCVNMNAWDRYGKPDVCNRCVDYSNFESDQKFCECCGSPLTAEAVQMVMERLEALKNEKGN